MPPNAGEWMDKRMDNSVARQRHRVVPRTAHFRSVGQPLLQAQSWTLALRRDGWFSGLPGRIIELHLRHQTPKLG